MQSTYALPTDRELRALSQRRTGYRWQRGDAFRGPRDYYERSTREDREALGREVPHADDGMGRWAVFSEYAPRDIDRTQADPREVERALAGEFRGQHVRNANGEDRRPAFDLVFSVPKSPSILYATGNEETRARIDRYMEESAREVVERYIGREVSTRLGHAGAEHERASFAAVMYTQHLSRANDPQGHVHVIIPNMSWTHDGQLRTLESQWLFDAQRGGGPLFQAGVLDRMRADGYEFHADREGVVRAQGVDERLEQFFSARSSQINAIIARDELRAQGLLDEDIKYRVDGHELRLAAGEHVTLTHDDERLGVRAGEHAQIIDIDRAGDARLKLDATADRQEREVSLTRADIERTVDGRPLLAYDYPRTYRDDAAPWTRDAAAVYDRPHHDPNWRENWHERAVAAGLGAEWDRAAAAHEAARERVHQREIAREHEPEAVREIRAQQHADALDRVTDASIRDLIYGTDRLAATGEDTPGRALVDRHHLVAEVAAHVRGLGGGIDDVLAAVQRAEDRGAIVVLDRHDEQRASMHDRFSTSEFIEREARMRDQWAEMTSRGETGHGVTIPDRLLDGLNAEQQAALRAMTADRQVAVIEGVAGVGKTTLEDRARQLYEDAGFRVVGEAHSGIAAQEMAQRAGIESRTIALAETQGRELDRNTVVIMDEAQTGSSLQHARVIDEAYRSGAKLILVGDPGRRPDRDDPGLPGQHVAVGPGVPARHLASVVRDLAPEATNMMREIQRQREPELRHVATLAAVGRGADALREADARGWVRVTESSQQMRAEAARYLADALGEGRSALAVVGSRQEQAAVNTAARDELRSRGMLGDEAEYRIGEGKRARDLSLAPGDRVAFGRNDYDIGVRTGQRAEVVAVHRDAGELLLRLEGPAVRADRGGNPVLERRETFHDAQGQRAITDPTREIVLNRADVERLVRGRPLVDHDYARTSQRAQSATVDRAVVAVHHQSQALSRQFGAVALTRSREDLRVVISAQGLERAGSPELVAGDRVAFARTDQALGVHEHQQVTVVAVGRHGDALLRLDHGAERVGLGGQVAHERREIFTDARGGQRLIAEPTHEIVLNRSEIDRLLRADAPVRHGPGRAHEADRDREPTREDPHWPRDHGQPDSAQQRLFVDPEVRKAALVETGQRLGRDAPGETTLNYRDAPDRAREARERELAHLRGEDRREPAAARTRDRDADDERRGGSRGRGPDEDEDRRGQSRGADIDD